MTIARAALKPGLIDLKDSKGSVKAWYFCIESSLHLSYIGSFAKQALNLA